MAPTDGDFDGNEFTNNLFSDLAPLLALFGEQVTKQFLSMSFGWVDNIMLAMGPLGIITIVVSAIRVGGPKWLKALVGRAREERCSAEQELLTSTSDDVCEMWYGRGIVRTKGQPPMGLKTLVITSTGVVLNMEHQWASYFHPPSGFEESPKWKATERVLEIMKKNDAAPNLALTVKGSRQSMLEAWVLALVSLVLQLGALAVTGLARYHWEWLGADSQFSSYAGYPFYLLGSILLSLGILGCGRAIEAVTVEQTLECQEKMMPHIAIIRLQQACTVGDQHFQSFALLNMFDRPDIRISTWKDTNNVLLVTASTGATAAGFFLQFIGLRSLHWSAAMIQLGVTVAMTFIRAYARRGLALNPPNFEIMRTHEMAWLALGVSEVCRGQGDSAAAQTITNSSTGDSIKWNQKWEEYSASTNTSSPLRWEVATGAPEMPMFRILPDYILRPRLFQLPRLAKPLTTSISRVLRTPDGAGMSADMMAFAGVAGCISDATSLPPGVGVKVDQLERSIKGVIDLLTTAGNVAWKDEPIFGGENASRRYPVTWEFSIIYGRHSRNSLDLETRKLDLDVLADEKRDSMLAQAKVMPRTWLGTSFGLQSILCFWLRTLALKDPCTAMHSENGGFYATRPFFRIVGPADSSEVLSKWMGGRIGDLRMTTKEDVWESYLAVQGPDSPCFGMHFTHLSNNPDSQSGPQHYTFTTLYGDIVSQCAQELFSLFILAIADRISDIGGHTSMCSDKGGIPWPRAYVVSPRVWDNTLLTSLAKQAVLTGLVDSLEEGLALVIPAFTKHNLLPKTAGDKPQQDGGVGEDVAEGQQVQGEERVAGKEDVVGGGGC